MIAELWRVTDSPVPSSLVRRPEAYTGVAEAILTMSEVVTGGRGR
jgi:hypothetical protein